MYLPITLKNGKTFHVEVAAESVDPAVDRGVFSGGAGMGGKATVTDLAEKHFSEAVAIVQGIAAEVSEALVKHEDGKKDDTSRRPSEVALELQLGFDAGGKVLCFAEAKASAAMKLTLKWTLPK
jgi:hypothetical protein